MKQLTAGSDGLPSMAVARPAVADAVSASSLVYAGSTGLLDYWQMIRRRKWWIGLFMLGGILLGLAATILQPVVYTARASIEVQGLNESFMNLNLVDPQAGTGANLPSEPTIQTQIQIIESESLRMRAMQRMEREGLPMMPPESDFFVPARIALRITAPDPIEFTRRATLMASMTVKAAPMRGSRVIEVKCESLSPEFAAAFLNTLTAEYVDQAMEGRLKAVQGTTKWMAERLTEIKTKLEDSEDRLQTFLRSSGLAQTDTQETLADSKLKRLQTELSAMQADRIAKQARFEMASKSDVDALPDVLDDPELRGYQQRLVDLRRQLAELSTTLTPANYKVQKVQSQIAELEGAVAKSRANILQRIRNDYEAAQRREKLLAAAYAEESRTVAAQADKALSYNLLKREVDTNRQLYQMLMQQVNQANVAVALPAQQTRILDTARPAARPSKPIWWLYLLVGTSTGVLAGCGFALLLGHVDVTVRTPGHIAGMLEVPELGAVPSSKFLRKEFRRSLPVYKRIIPRFSSRAEVDIRSWRGKPSILADSMRVILASVVFGDAGGKRRPVIVVTSAGALEGKTTITANLGIGLSDLGMRTLLIGADARNPSLSQRFNIPNEAGFSELLADGVPIESVPSDRIARPTAVQGLFVLPWGEDSGEPANLFYSPRARQLIERVRDEFDFVLIDTPPITFSFDTRALVRLADAAILVVRSGVTPRAAVASARDRVIETGTPLLGTILNDWEPVHSVAASSYPSSHRKKA